MKILMETILQEVGCLYFYHRLFLMILNILLIPLYKWKKCLFEICWVRVINVCLFVAAKWQSHGGGGGVKHLKSWPPPPGPTIGICLSLS